MFSICGDFNARCADFQDCIAGVDSIPERQVIDFTANKHGELLCEFLINSNCCMLNGRNLESSANEFTCIQSQGSSVVDYGLVPHEDHYKYTDFKVWKMSDLIIKPRILNTLDVYTSRLWRVERVIILFCYFNCNSIILYLYLLVLLLLLFDLYHFTTLILDSTINYNFTIPIFQFHDSYFINFNFIILTFTILISSL